MQGGQEHWPRKSGLQVSALMAEHKMYPELPGSSGEKGNRIHTSSLQPG